MNAVNNSRLLGFAIAIVLTPWPAEISAEGTHLTVKDVTIFGPERTALPRGEQLGAMLQLRTDLVTGAKEAGFEKLTLQGIRVETSSSANPGKVIETTIDLTGR